MPLTASVIARALFGCLCLVPLQATTAPFVPQNDDEVVERLPARMGSAADRLEQRLARERLWRDPQQLPLALHLARTAIDRARRLGDPRELGQAQAALGAWWSLPEPPPTVRLLRATVFQSQHAFEKALSDLEALLKPEARVPLPLQAQAELMRASVLQVQGRWTDAAAGCARLNGERYRAVHEAVRLPAQACLAELSSLQGHGAQAEAQLAALSRSSAIGGDDNGQAVHAWLTLVRAELAERRGAASAEPLYRQALQASRESISIASSGTPAGAAGNADVYTLGAYADWLLDHGRAEEVVGLLEGHEDADALLLRWAIALKRTQDARAAAAIAQLGQRFEASALRGDTTHGRERARYALELQDDAPTALNFAQANWAVQREPADLLILARAAQAAQRAEAADPVRRLIAETGYEDVRLGEPASAVQAKRAAP